MVIEFHNAAAGIPIRAPRRMEHVQRDRDIIIKEEELVTGRISVFDYLLHSSNFFFPIRYDLENPLPVRLFRLTFSHFHPDLILNILLFDY